MIELDRDRIIQVLSNLVNNALNSSNKRRIIGNNEVFPIEIFMKKDDSSEEITIRVRDGGKIWAHGGKIWAYNNSNGRGATFCFTLPLKTVPRGLSSER